MPTTVFKSEDLVITKKLNDYYILTKKYIICIFDNDRVTICDKDKINFFGFVKDAKSFFLKNEEYSFKRIDDTASRLIILNNWS